MRRLASSLYRDCRGAAAVEIVLIMPLAILMIVLTMEAGNYLYSEHQVVKGVRDAARYAARLPFSTYNCTGTSAEADLSTTNASWQTIANVAVYGSVAATGTGINKRLWTWSAAPADGEVVVRYACVANTAGVYSQTGYAPQVAVIGKPDYNSLFKTMTGLSGSMKLYARQQAAGDGI